MKKFKVLSVMALLVLMLAAGIGSASATMTKVNYPGVLQDTSGINHNINVDIYYNEYGIQYWDITSPSQYAGIDSGNVPSNVQAIVALPDHYNTIWLYWRSD